MPRVCIERVSKDLYILRVDDDEVRFFESIWEIPEGITYNSYVLTSEEGAIVFDTWKSRYSQLFVDTLKSLIDLKDVKYIVVHHMEPDHSGSLPQLVSAVGLDRVAIVGFSMVKDMMKAFYGFEPRHFKPVKDGDSIRLGSYTIKFVHTPWLHWPETIMSYIEELRVLLSCDAFGGYSIPRTVFDDGIDVDEYLRFVRKYIVTVIGFYTKFIVSNIEKLRSLGIEVGIVAPAHGVVWRRDPTKIIDYYYKLARGELVNPRKVTIVYSSMYGFLEETMHSIARILRDMGFEVAMHGFTDIDRASIANALSDAFDSIAIVLGISTYEGSAFPLMSYFMDILGKKIKLPKKIVVAICYGWGTPRKIVETKLKEVGVQSVEVIDFRGKATKQVVNRIVKAVANEFKHANRS